MKIQKRTRWATGMAITAIASVSLAGCNNQNPFPQTGILTPEKPPVAQKTDPLLLSSPELMEFTEGQPGEYPIIAGTLDQGQLVVAAYDLPEGAVFDVKKLLLKWTPSLQAADNENDLTQLTRSYKVRFAVSSSTEPTRIKQRTATLLVRNVARDISIQPDTQTGARQGTLEVREGETLVRDYRVVSPDFPKGPFVFTAKNLPAGAVLETNPNNPASFALKYSPDFSLVTTDENSSDGIYYKTLKLEVVAIGPRAQQTALPLEITVQDVRQMIQVTAPDQLLVGTEANFAVSAEDLNGEVTPTISIDSKPDFGRVRIESMFRRARARGNGNPTGHASATWDQVPVANLGKPYELKVKACGKDHLSGEPNCTVQTVQVTFGGERHNPPILTRQEWKAGTIRYLREGEIESVAVDVEPAERSEGPATVEILPEAMRDEVKWSEGTLFLSPKTAGPKQFQVVATSAFGVRTSESFNLEILPKAWSPTLVLVETLASAETKALLKLFPGAQLINGGLQAIDERMLIMRDTLVLTTGAIQGEAVPAEITKLSERFRRVVVMTPIMEKAFWPNQMTATIYGRFLDQPGHPDLAALDVVPVPGSGLTATKLPVRLTQKLTSESKSPLLLAPADGSTCATVLKLQRRPMVEMPIAISCSRADGGKILWSGIEWADLVADGANPNDEPVGVRWLKEWLGTPKEDKK